MSRQPIILQNNRPQYFQIKHHANIWWIPRCGINQLFCLFGPLLSFSVRFTNVCLIWSAIPICLILQLGSSWAEHIWWDTGSGDETERLWGADNFGDKVSIPPNGIFILTKSCFLINLYTLTASSVNLPQGLVAQPCGGLPHRTRDCEHSPVGFTL